MKKLVNFYVANPRLIGAIYCAVPSVIWFGVVLASVPFREVYVLRFALCLIVGCPIGAYLNKYGLELWLMKHKIAGPGKIIDGALNGAAIGLGTALLPALTALIKTHHPEEAKTFIIALYIASALTGFIIGGTATAAGRDFIER
jgi:hypothetical protein